MTTNQNIELYKKNREKQLNINPIFNDINRNSTLIHNSNLNDDLHKIGNNFNHIKKNNSNIENNPYNIKGKIINNINHISNNINGTSEKGIGNEDYDSDEEAFKVKEEVNNQQIDQNNNNDDEGEELSSLSNVSMNNEEIKDFLYTKYEKVHRVKSKWKCNFKDAVLQINGKEYIFDKIVGELERDW